MILFAKNFKRKTFNLILDFRELDVCWLVGAVELAEQHN